MNVTSDVAWWYWTLTVILLGVGLAGLPLGFGLAIALCVIQLIHVAWLTRSTAAFPVQVRIAYLALLLAGTWDPLQWIHAVQLVGTSARVLVGYCLLARTLSLAPWNRRQPLSLDLVRRTLLSLRTSVPPCGAVFRGLSLEQVSR